MIPKNNDLPAARRPAPGARSRAGGFTLVELMIAVALGLVILAALTSFFVQTSQNRSELDRNSRQIENGRFAADILREDLSLAGHYADLVQPTGTVWQVPAACTTAVGSLGFAPSALNPQIPVPIFGYPAGAGAPPCLANLVAGTDVLVVRRVNTERTAPATPSATQYYLQVSECATDNPATPFVFAAGAAPGSFTLHKLDCTALADLWRWREHVYYIRNCSICGTDTIPTLVRLELNGSGAAGTITEVPLVEGIQDMRVDFGMDTNNNGIPDIWRRCDAASPCAANDWRDVVAAKVHLLARNLEGSPGYVDNKSYNLGLSGAVAAPGDNVKRHVYTAVVNLNNRSGLRETAFAAWPAAPVTP